MASASLVLWAALHVLAADPAAATDATLVLPVGGPPGLEIHLVHGWGAAPDEDVGKVLQSAAAQLWPNCGPRRLAPLIVRYDRAGPKSLYAKGPSGEYRIQLSAKDTFWCQYAYQFAHELSHVLCNYDRRKAGVNLWFEEAVCDTSSLFVLRKMAAAWATAPPYPNWREFSRNLESYVNVLLVKPHRRLPPDETMPTWLARNLPELRSETQLLPRSELVASYLLPIFEADPETWATLAWLNQGPDDATAEFHVYLEGWYRRTPAAQQPHVGKILTLFGVPLPGAKQ